jgi:hypothetical protein
MPGIDPCRDEVLKAIGRDKLSPAEEALIARHAGKLKARIDAGGDPKTVLQNFAEERASEKAARQVRAAGNEVARAGAQARKDAAADFGSRAPAQVLQSMLVSSLKTFTGAMDSLGKRIKGGVDAAQERYLTAIEQAGLTDYVFKGSDQLNIWKALDALNHEQDAVPFGSNAVKAATIFKKNADTMLLLKGDAYIPSGRIEDWTGPQMHDPYAIGKAGGNRLGSDASADAWIKDVLPNVNWDKTFGGELLNADISLKVKRLRSLWEDFVSGKHLEYGSVNSLKNRELYFKDVDSQYAYNQKYGGGRTLGENINGWLTREARNVEIAKMFGSDPEGFVKRLSNEWGKQLKDNDSLSASQRAKAQKDLAAVEKAAVNRYLPSLTGGLGLPENAVAYYAYNAQQMANALAVGAATPVVLGDLPLFMNNMARYGGPAMTKHFGYLADTVKTFMDMPPAQRKIAAALAEIQLSDGTNPLARANQGEYVAGAVHGIEKFIYKTALHTGWVDRIRPAATVMHGAYHWFERNKAYADLDPALQDGFEKFGIGEKDWDIIRKSEAGDVLSNVKAFGPAAIRRMDREQFRSIAGAEASDAILRRAQNGIADRYRNFLGHMGDSVTSSTSPELQALSSGGIPRNSLAGFLVNSFNSLKSFTYRLTRDHYGAMVAGDRNPENLGWATMLKNFTMGRGGDPGGRVAMTKFAANNVLFGMLIVQLSLLRNGEAPIVPDTPEKAGDLLWRGFVRQGAGLYGDLIARQLEQPDRNFFETVGKDLLGPLVGDAADLADASKRVVTSGAKYAAESDYSGDKFWKQLRRAGGQAARVGYSLTPGTNFLWTKFATDYYLKDNLLDAINPGYKDRLVKRARQAGTPVLLAGPQ